MRTRINVETSQDVSKIPPIDSDPTSWQQPSPRPNGQFFQDDSEVVPGYIVALLIVGGILACIGIAILGNAVFQILGL